ncbi:CBO0543 family protein [Metabacillus litoralis]|uniref:CBO0543 family protein n=1 Tax=Metabacillus litoralis TaxID=152268 RepID=UPI003B281296
MLWFLYRRKESTDRLLYVAFIVIIISIVLDVIGDQYGIWHYRYNVFPIIPTYFPWDFTLMPVSIISLLQFKPKASPWIKAGLFALGSSYIGEPFFYWIGVYQTIHWKFTYSVPIQFCIYLFSHWIYNKEFHIN